MPQLVTSGYYVNRCFEIFGNGSTFQVARDDKVYCPSHEFMVGEFSERLDKLTPKYIQSAYDCEDFCAEAQALMARVVGDYVSRHDDLPKAGNSLGYIEGIIRGELNGVRDGVHATLFFLDDNDVIWFYEPQPSTPRTTDAFQAMESGIFVPRSVRP